MDDWRGCVQALLAAVAILTASSAAAQDTYPVRPIRMLVGFAPGGTADVVARILANRLPETLGQPVFIENKAGAGGTIAHALTAQSPPDGYTYVLATNSTFAIAPHLYLSLPYDHEKALTSVAYVTSSSMALCVHSSVPARTVAELIALTRAKPGELSFSTAGLGATSHLAAELFMSMAGLRMRHVPYRSGSQAVQAVVAGDVQLAFVDTHVARSLTSAGHIRILGVTSLARHPLALDIPTVSDAGLPGFEMATTTGLFSPSALPAPILARMEKEVVAALQRSEIANQYTALGLEVIGKDHVALDAHVKSESAKWGKVMRERGIKLPQ
jgi:tripartite-type tricarboxylate transporter receptor subunit TctC